MNTPVMLVVLDGFGLAPEGPGNAVTLADTPNFERYWASYPHTELAASGRAVGLPEGQMGNSEVGHLNIGAGRVVLQSLSFIQHQLDTGALRDNAVLNALFEKSARLHVMGLVSDGGVHSDIRHLRDLLELAAAHDKPCFVHAFTDGRDTAPDSALGFIQELETFLATLPDARIASVSGRYYAMDRDKRWERIRLAYEALVCGHGVRAERAEEAVRRAYLRGETDEFILPTALFRDGAPVATLEDGDGVLFFNFRADRARQLSAALLSGPDWDAGHFQRCRAPQLNYASLMQVDPALVAPYALELPPITLPLAEVLSRHGKTQYHTAETEKYPHVTFFFNAQQEPPFPGEVRAIIPSPQDVPTYDLRPEMSAPELTEHTLARIREHQDDFILINYANPDMVGHTGVLSAAVRAVEAADVGLGQIVEAFRTRGGAVLIIADHGNAEKMLDEDGKPHTAHTTNPVPCVVISDKPGLRLREGGVLGDVAPTVLQLMGVPQPPEMTGRTLIE